MDFPSTSLSLSVLQVSPAHDRVQLTSSAHPRKPLTAQQQGDVASRASRSQHANRGTKYSNAPVHVQRAAGPAWC